MKRFNRILTSLLLVGVVLGGAFTAQARSKSANKRQYYAPPTASQTVQQQPKVTVAPKPAVTVAPKPAVTVAPKPAVTVPPKPAITVQPRPPAPGAPFVRRDGEYTDRDGIAAYIVAYGCLPRNFITKSEARRLGWQGGPLEPYAPGKSIGGDHYGNYERVLPNGRYRECDVDTRGRPRGAKRIVFTDDRKVYYSDDHYRTFKRIK